VVKYKINFCIIKHEDIHNIFEWKRGRERSIFWIIQYSIIIIYDENAS
jgi:hypothetical protein